MKRRLLRPFAAAAMGLAALSLSACATSGGGAFTLGYTGRNGTGGDYVVGLSIPFSLRPAAAPAVPEPALPAGNGSGKTPVLVSP